MSTVELIVDPDLEKLLDKTDQTCNDALDKLLIQAGGAFDTIKVWRGKNIIVDGHRRYRACVRLGLPYDVKELDFADLDAVKYWMHLQQVSRRNQSGQERAISLGAMAEHEQKKGLKAAAAVAKVAEETGVDQRTVFRAKQFKRCLNALPKPISDRISSGELTISHEDMVEFATFDEAEQYDIVAQLDSGEFKNLHEVLQGVEEEGAELASAEFTDRPSVKPKPLKDLVRDCEEALGQLYKALDKLDSATDNAPKYHTCKSRLREVGELIRDWGKESAQKAVA